MAYDADFYKKLKKKQYDRQRYLNQKASAAASAASNPNVDPSKTFRENLNALMGTGASAAETLRQSPVPDHRSPVTLETYTGNIDHRTTGINELETATSILAQRRTHLTAGQQNAYARIIQQEYQHAALIQGADKTAILPSARDQVANLREMDFDNLGLSEFGLTRETATVGAMQDILMGSLYAPLARISQDLVNASNERATFDEVFTNSLVSATQAIFDYDEGTFQSHAQFKAFFGNRDFARNEQRHNQQGHFPDMEMTDLITGGANSVYDDDGNYVGLDNSLGFDADAFRLRPGTIAHLDAQLKKLYTTVGFEIAKVRQQSPEAASVITQNFLSQPLSLELDDDITAELKRAAFVPTNNFELLSLIEGAIPTTPKVQDRFPFLRKSIPDSSTLPLRPGSQARLPRRDTGLLQYDEHGVPGTTTTRSLSVLPGSWLRPGVEWVKPAREISGSTVARTARLSPSSLPISVIRPAGLEQRSVSSTQSTGGAIGIPYIDRPITVKDLDLLNEILNDKNHPKRKRRGWKNYRRFMLEMEGAARDGQLGGGNTVDPDGVELGAIKEFHMADITDVDTIKHADDDGSIFTEVEAAMRLDEYSTGQLAPLGEAGVQDYAGFLDLMADKGRQAYTNQMRGLLSDNDYSGDLPSIALIPRSARGDGDTGLIGGDTWQNPVDDTSYAIHGRIGTVNDAMGAYLVSPTGAYTEGATGTRPRFGSSYPLLTMNVGEKPTPGQFNSLLGVKVARYLTAHGTLKGFNFPSGARKALVAQTARHRNTVNDHTTRLGRAMQTGVILRKSADDDWVLIPNQQPRLPAGKTMANVEANNAAMQVEIDRARRLEIDYSRLSDRARFEDAEDLASSTPPGGGEPPGGDPPAPPVPPDDESDIGRMRRKAEEAYKALAAEYPDYVKDHFYKSEHNAAAFQAWQDEMGAKDPKRLGRFLMLQADLREEHLFTQSKEGRDLGLSGRSIYSRWAKYQFGSNTANRWHGKPFHKGLAGGPMAKTQAGGAPPPRRVAEAPQPIAAAGGGGEEPPLPPVVASAAADPEEPKKPSGFQPFVNQQGLLISNPPTDAGSGSPEPPEAGTPAIVAGPMSGPASTAPSQSSAASNPPPNFPPGSGYTAAPGGTPPANNGGGVPPANNSGSGTPRSNNNRPGPAPNAWRAHADSYGNISERTFDAFWDHSSQAVRNQWTDAMRQVGQMPRPQRMASFVATATVNNTPFRPSDAGVHGAYENAPGGGTQLVGADGNVRLSAAGVERAASTVRSALDQAISKGALPSDVESAVATLQKRVLDSVDVIGKQIYDEAVKAGLPADVASQRVASFKHTAKQVLDPALQNISRTEKAVRFVEGLDGGADPDDTSSYQKKWKDISYSGTRTMQKDEILQAAQNDPDFAQHVASQDPTGRGGMDAGAENMASGPPGVKNTDQGTYDYGRREGWGKNRVPTSRAKNLAGFLYGVYLTQRAWQQFVAPEMQAAEQYSDIQSATSFAGSYGHAQSFNQAGTPGELAYHKSQAQFTHQQAAYAAFSPVIEASSRAGANRTFAEVMSVGKVAAGGAFATVAAGATLGAMELIGGAAAGVGMMGGLMAGATAAAPFAAGAAAAVALPWAAAHGISNAVNMYNRTTQGDGFWLTRPFTEQPGVQEYSTWGWLNPKWNTRGTMNDTMQLSQELARETNTKYEEYIDAVPAFQRATGQRITPGTDLAEQMKSWVLTAKSEGASYSGFASEQAAYASTMGHVIGTDAYAAAMNDYAGMDARTRYETQAQQSRFNAFGAQFASFGMSPREGGLLAAELGIDTQDKVTASSAFAGVATRYGQATGKTQGFAGTDEWGDYTSYKYDQGYLHRLGQEVSPDVALDLASLANRDVRGGANAVQTLERYVKKGLTSQQSFVAQQLQPLAVSGGISNMQLADLAKSTNLSDTGLGQVLQYGSGMMAAGASAGGVMGAFSNNFSAMQAATFSQLAPMAMMSGISLGSFADMMPTGFTSQQNAMLNSLGSLSIGGGFDVGNTATAIAGMPQLNMRDMGLLNAVSEQLTGFGVDPARTIQQFASMASPAPSGSARQYMPQGWQPAPIFSTGQAAFMSNNIGSIARSGGDVGAFISQVASTPMSDQQAYVMNRAAAGDLFASSFASYNFDGPISGRLYDQSRNPIYETDFNSFLGMLEGQAALGNTAAQNATQGMTVFSGAEGASQFFGSSDMEAMQAWADGGSRDRRLLQNQRQYENSMAGIGVGFAQIALRRQFMYGSGTWDNPAAGSMYALQDEMTRLGYQSQMAGFAYSSQQMQAQNQYSIFQEGLSSQRMSLNRGMQVWQQGFDATGMQQSQLFTQQQWGRQDQMNSLQFGWQMEDFDEAIRGASGRQRRTLIRQRDRATTSQNLQEESRDAERKQQEELWKREEERYQKRVAYETQIFNLEKEGFEGSVDQRKKMFDMEMDNLDRREDEYKKQFALQMEMQDLQRKFQEDSMALQAAALGVQAVAAQQQKDFNDEMIKTTEGWGDTKGIMEQINSYDNAKTVLQAMGDAVAKVDAVGKTAFLDMKNMASAIQIAGTSGGAQKITTMVGTINSLSITKLDYLIRLLNGLA